MRKYLPLLILLAGCKTHFDYETGTRLPNAPVKPTPPAPPGLSESMSLPRPAAVVIQQNNFPVTLVWDFYSNNVSSNLIVQASDDMQTWTNKVVISPVWASNVVFFSETGPKHFYRLMVQ